MFDEATLELAKLMQDAALDPMQWDLALNTVSKFTGSSGAVLLSVENRQRFAPTSTDIAEMMDDYFNQGWYANDKRDASIPFLKQRGIVFDHNFQTTEDIENCDFYSDLLARHKRKWFAGVGAEVDGDYWCLALQRRPESEPYGKRDLARLQVLRGVLANTAHLSKGIGQTWIAGLKNALEIMEHPAILFDSRAHVVDLNYAAARIMKSFINKDRRVCFASAQTTADFQRILRNALLPLEATSLGARGRIIAIGDAGYQCQAINLLGHKGLIACNAAILFLMKPAVKSPENVLRVRYGLTMAEVKVAMALTDGKSVQEVATNSTLKADTIRSYLKSIYGKTDVRKQSQLVAFVRKLDDY